METIGKYAFQSCGFTSITLPSGLKTIHDSAFMSCEDLTSITIPSTVSTIGENPFRSCSKLTSISVNSSSSYFSSVDGVLFNKNKTTLVIYPAGKSSTSYTVPSTVTAIADCAFYYVRKISSLTLSSSLTSIGAYAFYANIFNTITLPSSLTTIESGAFSSCSLTSITIPSGITTINNYTFTTCSNLTTVSLPRTVTSIGSGAFDSCSSLTTVNYDETESYYMANLGSHIGTNNDPLTNATWVFANPDLQYMTFELSSDGTYYILTGISSDFTKSTLEIPATFNNKPVKEIGSYVLSQGNYSGTIVSSITSVIISEGVTTINDRAFYFTRNVKSISLPNTLIKIGQYAFSECGITTITIPASVTEIGYDSFDTCQSLTSIVVNSSNTATS